MSQVAALPYRTINGSRDAIEVLLVTSFRSGRWIIPKGDVDNGMEPPKAAAKEAEEEGSVKGQIGSRAIGTFCTEKKRNGDTQHLDVVVYPLAVNEVLTEWAEMNDRQRRWVPPVEAAKLVQEQDLAGILRAFRP